MVLSETRGLQLCWIMRGGIGSAWRLGAEAHKSPNFWLDTLPRSERLKRNPTATAKEDPQGMEREPTQLLGFLGTLQPSSQVTVLRAVARLNRETAVGP